MSDKAKAYAYWASTSLLAIGMVLAGIQEVRHVPTVLEAAQRLGFPEYFITVLGVAKLVGAPILLIPGFPHLKEWAYAGFCFDFGGAVVSHTASGDTLFQTLPAILCAALLGVCYWSYRIRGLERLRAA
jgi:hypothetical protein